MYTWECASDLVIEVMGARPEGKSPPLHELWGTIADPELTARHRFSLVDASGREVKFPLKLVSDTRIYSDKGADVPTSS